MLLLLLGLLAVGLLPVAFRIRIQADGGITSLQLDAGLCRGVCGLCMVWQKDTWELHLLLGRWPVRWPAWKLIGASPKSASQPARPAAAPPPKKHAARRFGSGTALRMWRPLVEILKGVPGSISVHHGTVVGMLGCANPAQTGWAFGIQHALQPFPMRNLHISIAPCFTRAGFHGRAEVVLHLHVHRLLWASVRVALKLLYRRLSIPWQAAWARNRTLSS